MNKYIFIFISSVLAGLCITIGAVAYLSLINLNKIVGSFLFGLGLFTIIHFGLYLYTGKVGFVLDNKPKYFLDLLICIIGNFVGMIVFSSIFKLTRIGDNLILEATKLVETKQGDTWYSIFFLAYMCGIMIYLAVKGHQKCEYPLGKALFCFLAIMVFILCGYEHCIANAAYYTLAGVFNLKALLYFLVMIIGNGLGSISLDGLLKLMDKFKNKIN